MNLYYVIISCEDDTHNLERGGCHPKLEGGGFVMGEGFSGLPRTLVM